MVDSISMEMEEVPIGRRAGPMATRSAKMEPRNAGMCSPTGAKHHGGLSARGASGRGWPKRMTHRMAEHALKRPYRLRPFRVWFILTNIRNYRSPVTEVADRDLMGGVCRFRLLSG